MIVNPRLACLFGLTACALSALAQNPSPPTDSSKVTKALRALVELASEAPPAEFASRTMAVAEALGDQPGVEPLRSATDLLAGIADWRSFPAEHVDDLVQAIKEHRGKPSSELLLPVVLMAERVAGDRLEVQLAVAEAFGQESCIGDSDRARAALRRLVAMLPTDLEGFQRTAEQVRSFGRFLGDERLGKEGIATLRSYLALLERAPVPTSSMHVLTPDDLKAFNTIGTYVDKQRRGDQKAAVDLLEQMRTLQPRNAAFLLPLAEARASLGPAFDYHKAKKCLQDFLVATDPDAADAPARDPWEGFDALRETLSLLQWGDLPGQPGRDATVESLRECAGELLPRIRMAVAYHLVISPDRDRLEDMAKLMQRQEPGLVKDLEEANAVFERARDQCEKAETAYKSAGSGRGGFNQRRADLHDRWMSTKVALDRAKKELARASEQLDINQRRNKDYTDRLKLYGR